MADAADYTVDGLLTAVRDYANLSANAEDTADDRLLRLFNREQGLYLAALLQRAQSKYRDAVLEIAVTSSLTYDIPRRAIAAGLVKVEGVDDNGQTWMLFELNDAQRSKFWPRNGNFYVQGNQLIFYTAPPTGTLRFTYPRRLSQLVLTESVGIISAINTAAGVVTLVGTPPATFVSGKTFDLVRATPHFDLLAMEVVATISGTALTFAPTDLPAGLEVGDYVCLPGQTAACSAPYELHAVLAQRVALMWLTGKGDPLANTCAEMLKQMQGDAMAIIEPRVEKEAPLSNPFAPGWGQGSRGWRRS